MKCLVLESFAGLSYSGARGSEINLPVAEAKSLEYSGLVKILEDYTAPIAFETPEAAMGKQTRIIKPKK